METQIKYCENWWVNLCPYNTRVSLGLFREWNNSIWWWSRQWSICFSSEKLPSSDPRLQSAQNGSVILVPRFVNTNENLFGSLWFGNCTQNWYFLSKLGIPLISRDMCDFKALSVPKIFHKNLSSSSGCFHSYHIVCHFCQCSGSMTNT